MSHFNEIEKPEFWCKDWYLDKKERGYTDSDIASDFLYIDRAVLTKWKKELGIAGTGRRG